MTHAVNPARRVLRPDMLSATPLPYSEYDDGSDSVLDIGTPELTGLAVFKDEDDNYHLLFRPWNVSFYEGYQVVNLEAAFRLWPGNPFIQTLHAWFSGRTDHNAFAGYLSEAHASIKELYDLLTGDAFPADTTSPAVVSNLLEVKHPDGSVFFAQVGTQVREIWVHEAAASDNNPNDLCVMLLRLLQTMAGETEVTLRQYDGSALAPDLHAAIRSLYSQMRVARSALPITSLPAWSRPKVQGVLARYATSTQAEPFVNVVTLLDLNERRTLNLGVGLHDQNLGLFCNGVPVDIGYPDFKASGGKYSEALNRLQNHIQARSRASMEVLLGDVDSLEALYAMLTGRAPV